MLIVSLSLISCSNKPIWLVPPILLPQIDYVTVTFDPNVPEGEEGNVTGMPENETFASGTVLEEPISSPSFSGYVFSGWYTETGEAYTFGIPVTENLVLYAHWTTTVTDDNGVSYSINTDGKSLSITGYNGTEANLVIPAEIGGYPVTEVGIYAFWRNKTIKSIVLPEGVTDIGFQAFYDDTQQSPLEKVVLPKTLKSIGIEAFRGNRNLKTIKLPDELENIGNSAFYDCRELEDIGEDLPGSLKTIGEKAFKDTYVLSMYITIPSGVKEIGNEAFRGSGITGVKFNDGLEKIGQSAFTKSDNASAPDYSLTGEIIIPDSVTELGQNAFTNTKITKVVVGTGVQNIPEYAFDNCSLLESVEVKGAKTIGGHAFSNLSSLENITLNEGLETIGTWAFGNIKKDDGANIEILVLPASLKHIASSAFQSTDGITNIELKSTETDLFTGSSSVFLYLYGSLYLPNIDLQENCPWTSGWNGQRSPLYYGQTYGGNR